MIFLVVKPLAYFAFIQTFRYYVARAIPMTFRRAAGLALLRSVIGVVLIGGGAYLILCFTEATRRNLESLSWMYLYAARIFAWWLVGKVGARVRGRRLIGWIVAGTVLNVAFDVAVVIGLFGGWVYPTIIVLIIFAFIGILHKVGRRASLVARFSADPLCHQCMYNLTGNISGICPECGTPIQSPPAPEAPPA